MTFGDDLFPPNTILRCLLYIGHRQRQRKANSAFALGLIIKLHRLCPSELHTYSSKTENVRHLPWWRCMHRAFHNRSPGPRWWQTWLKAEAHSNNRWCATTTENHHTVIIIDGHDAWESWQKRAHYGKGVTLLQYHCVCIPGGYFWMEPRHGTWDGSFAEHTSLYMDLSNIWAFSCFLHRFNSVQWHL